jgi:hypothetical protein
VKATEATVTYNARADFSTTNTPNGVWSHGYNFSLGGAMTLYPDHVINEDGFYTWRDNTNVIKIPVVTLIDTQFPWGFVPDSDELEIHPGRYGETSIIRWTAPRAGNHTI